MAERLIAAVVDHLAEVCPGRSARKLTIHLEGGSGKIKIPISRSAVRQLAATPAVFVPNANQAAMLAALKGRALHTDDLAREAKIDRREVHRKPGGIFELRSQGLVDIHPRLGHYSIEFPPNQLQEVPLEDEA